MGNIVANEGFIKQFATVADPETGAMVLNATHVSIWSAVNYAAQIVFQLISPITADRFGRRINLWVLTCLLTLVSKPLKAPSQELTVCSPSLSPLSPRTGRF